MTAQASLMSALICRAYGDPPALALADMQKPRPGEGQVLIAVAAAGISYVDVLMVRNLHQNKHPLPFSPGMEVVGHVAECGPGATHLPIGTRVAALVYDGGHAAFAVANAAETFVLPDACDTLRTAALLSVALTAEISLVERGGVQAGETVLVGGAAGGVGMCAVQLAKWHGAHVVAAASDAARCALACDAGADAALTYGPDFRERFQAAGREAADIVIDPVGGAFAEAAANLLDWDGRYVIVGFAGGTVPTFAANRLLVKNRAVLGMVLGHYRWRRPDILRGAADRVLRAIAEGALSGPITVVEGLGAVPAELARIADRRMLGKAVVAL
ncbi:zinc-binding dehydrogenase [Aquabacter spiritensis]|uniref:NADPH2:quinone reductase n=1 Tax=Aquabacter spiritensis TaxID=933073 RepID=A0A4R3LXT1_9HYPH|nr:zinc-binding dehydrogenase [Aquabacter spiritensis]TCT05471.1 NADPH2:quinone reductase [Aquabacter spiritensis]